MLRHSATWLAALLGWLAVLCVASSTAGAPHQPMPILHFDKLAHFSYFFAGGFLFAGWRLRGNPEPPSWRLILGSAVLAMALIGGLDEWHQTFTPGRSGNDPWDWLADLLGGSAGAFAFRAVYRKVTRDS